MTSIGDITGRLAAARRSALSCPHCGNALRTRSTRLIAPTVRQLYLQCVDLDCGAVFGADLTITHAISPSGRPNPAVHLRTSPPRRRTAANDDAPGGSEVPPPGDAGDPRLSTG